MVTNCNCALDVRRHKVGRVRTVCNAVGTVCDAVGTVCNAVGTVCDAVGTGCDAVQSVCCTEGCSAYIASCGSRCDLHEPLRQTEFRLGSMIHSSTGVATRQRLHTRLDRVSASVGEGKRE